jgi:hypothetical protein
MSLRVAGASHESYDLRGDHSKDGNEGYFISPSLKEETMGDGQQKPGITRRKVLIAAVTVAPPFALMAETARAKIQHSGVKYQTEPKDGKQCSDCNFFIAPNSCKQVDGNISPTGYCLLWAKKPG